jgi:type I restriction enzyme, S subunit
MKSAASKQTSADLKGNGEAVPTIAAADRMPFRSSELPERWRFVDLRSVCEKTSIWNPAREERDRFQYIDVSSVSNERFCIIDAQEIAGSSAPSRARKIVKAGDVIYATVRPSLKRVAWIEPRYDDQIASTAFCIVRADRKQAVSKFLYYILLSDDVNRKIIEHERGASYPAVTDKDVLNQFVPLPPPTEQKKIAAVLWKIQKAVEIEDAIVRNARDLKKSLLRRLFTHGLRGEPLKETEIGPLPQSWQVVRLGDAFDTQLGKMLSQKSRVGDEPKPYLRNKNVQWGRIEISDLLQMDFDEREKRKFLLRPNDLLVCEGGEPGRAAIWNGEMSECYYQKALHRLRPKDNRASNHFLAHWLAFSIQHENRYDVAGASSTIAHLPEVQLVALPIPLPSRDEQDEITDILQIVDRKIDIHESKNRSLQDFFKTTLHKLMTAQIRVNDLDIDTSEVEV